MQQTFLMLAVITLLWLTNGFAQSNACVDAYYACEWATECIALASDTVCLSLPECISCLNACETDEGDIALCRTTCETEQCVLSSQAFGGSVPGDASQSINTPSWSEHTTQPSSTNTETSAPYPITTTWSSDVFSGENITGSQNMTGSKHDWKNMTGSQNMTGSESMTGKVWLGVNMTNMNR
jgi:hypothetical protein